MKVIYNEKTFSIDLISDAYKTTNPFEICKYAKSDLNIDLTISEIIDYINYEEDFEKESYTISMKHIFN